VPASLYSTPGPRLIEGLEALAKLLHPDRFPATTQTALTLAGRNE
jgi:ABC-type Fe3+-hydroxamate transport system substrate-binding protein